MRTFGLFVALTSGVLATPLFAEDHIVTMTGAGFFPDIIHPSIGDTVVFENGTDTGMSATANDGSWSTGTLYQGDKFRLAIHAGLTQEFHYNEVQGLIDYNNPADVALGSD